MGKNMKRSTFIWSEQPNTNWFTWDGTKNFCQIPKGAGEFKFFQKIKSDREYLIVQTTKKAYNCYWDGKKFRLQGLKYSEPPKKESN